MTRKLIAAVLILAGTAAAFAMTEMDTDGDGALSIEEFLGAYPALTAVEFEAADANADGVIDADEHAAAVTAGVLPATEG